MVVDFGMVFDLVVVAVCCDSCGFCGCGFCGYGCDCG